jgi:hypothetical protein
MILTLTIRRNYFSNDYLYCNGNSKYCDSCRTAFRKLQSSYFIIIYWCKQCLRPAAAYGNYVDFTLSVVAPPTCLPPTGLVIANATTSSATIQWTVPATPPANGYDVYYNTTGVAPTAATVPQFTGVRDLANW